MEMNFKERKLSFRVGVGSVRSYVGECGGVSAYADEYEDEIDYEITFDEFYQIIDWDELDEKNPELSKKFFVGEEFVEPTDPAIIEELASWEECEAMDFVESLQWKFDKERGNEYD